MPKRIRIAIDGCGALTMHSILPHLAQPDFQAKAEVIALCDIVEERAVQLARQYSIGQVYSSYETMLAQSGADAVLVIVPAALHAAHAIQAARHGLHIYLQKPMATSFAEAQQVLDEAKSGGVRLAAAPGMALWPLYGRIREMIRHGVIGQPYLAQAPMLGWGGEVIDFPTNPAWFFGQASGPLRDVGEYSLQTLTTIFGPVRRVTAFSGISYPQRTWNGEAFNVTGDDNTAALLDFGGSLFGLWPEAWCVSSPAASVLRIHGLNGAIEGDGDSANNTHVFPFGCTVHPISSSSYRIEINRDEPPFLQGKHAEINNAHVYADILDLVDRIREEREPAASGSQALHTVEVIEAAFRAAATGQAQTITSTFDTPV